MTTGAFSNRFVFVRSYGFKALGLAALSAGLLLGGCNKDVKAENEALRTELADLKERVTSTEAERSAMAMKLEQSQRDAEVARNPQFNPKSPDYYQPDRPQAPKTPIAREGTRIRISGDNLFASGSVTLKPEAKKELSSHLSSLKGASHITIEGYTDTDPIKKSKYPSNQALSKARADSVKDYLVSKGISKSKISTVGKGAASPLATKKESRRVELVVVDIQID